MKTDGGSVHDKDNTYSWYDGDPATNGGYAGIPGDGTDTEDFIAALNSAGFGGYSDWRVPTRKELGSISDRGRDTPALDGFFFPYQLSSSYWSATTDASDMDDAWKVDFLHGNGNTTAKSTRCFVCAVRGENALSSSHLVDNGDGTVTDTTTGLMWQQDTPLPDHTWDEAIAHCEGLKLAGYDDWRLPNIRELLSLADFKTFDPSIDPVYFPGAKMEHYWTSTTDSSRPGYAWFALFTDGVDGASSKTMSREVRAVRSGQKMEPGHSVILSPAQASVWHGGAVMPIRWDKRIFSGNVTISLSRKGGKTGTFTETLMDNTENDGSHDWVVTGAPSVNCVLRIDPISDPAAGTAQGLFSIFSSDTPTALISGSPPGPTNSNDATLNVSGEGVTHYKYKLDAQDYGVERLVSEPIPLENLPDGSHVVSVIGRDLAGIWQTEPTTVTWEVDTEAPTAVVSGMPASPTRENSAEFTVSGDGVTHYRYNRDGEGYGIETPVATPIHLSGLADGEHSVSVIGRDEAGNWQPESNGTPVSWTVDTKAPEVTGLSHDEGPIRSKTWTWDADEGNVVFSI